MSRYIPDALRALVARRANYRCEYCLIQEEDSIFAHETGHFISLKHGRATEPENFERIIERRELILDGSYLLNCDSD